MRHSMSPISACFIDGKTFGRNHYLHFQNTTQEGIIDGKSPDAFRGQNVRFGSFPKDGFKERVATAIAQIDQSCCRWHLLEGPRHIGTMPTMDNHARGDPP